MSRAIEDGTMRFAGALRGVLAQRLALRRDGSGVALTVRMLAVEARVRDALRRLPHADADRELARLLADHAFEGA
jgi:Tfp pilus assembly pilus retraction ATPase PilT